ncbi:hypothetical protein DOTSEDRAFT_179879 [Dothistroma septosporum NZE10]|uniref:peptidylprolyl isomerase n=1 Tax=Dothistroma septosporum (strain NZE10 / CBS 128990) TaxID=675120 RepID=M2WK82_DOTSN|nr:hypothetical protein DOTSEDRAFT_179879 [Dothistroma septosporum NZE10]
MQRYTVTIVSPGGTPEQPRPVLAVPFEPSALVSAFIEELFRRIARQGRKLEPNTHIATLHLDSETGAIIDSEDLLGDVITDPKTEKLFAVFETKPATKIADEEAAAPVAESAPSAPQKLAEDQLAIRVVTPELAKNDVSALAVLYINKTATIAQLHDAVADHLKFPHSFDTSGTDSECNCTLAKRLADGASSPSHVYVIHDKSQGTKLEMTGSAATQANLDALILSALGESILTNKKVSNYGGVRALSEGVVVYKKCPTVAVCAKSRHVPAHARKEVDESSTMICRRVLDLHTSELPISRAASDSTLIEAGLEHLAADGAISIYAVKRASNNSTLAGSGKSAIFRHSACWEPAIKQSDRGIAMFLSSLRIFTSVIQDLGDDERFKDALYHAFDLLCRFPPALRALHILASGQTPGSMDCAAISGALFEVMDSFVPTEIIGNGPNRVFEGSRLLFGFMLEKARNLKLADDAVDAHSLPYLSAFESIDLRDHKTNEAVLHAVSTGTGLVEKSLFEALQDGVLVDSNIQTYLDRFEDVPRISRVALMSGGAVSEAVIFSSSKRAGDYLYADQGMVTAAFDATELQELHHVAELCGRNKLTVSMPSKLVSAVAPCLTFDRFGHLAVYTGQLPCSAPGQSSEIFRPKHGQETINETVLEQILAPILKTHEADGTAVFDVLGGSAAVKRLQSPDEILFVAVDVSASMRLASDFIELNECDEHASDNDTASTADSITDPEYYTKASFDDMKELLSSHEAFTDMVAIVAEARNSSRRGIASQVLELLRSSLSLQVMKKHAALEPRQQRRYGVGNQIVELRSSIDRLKTFFAGLRSHEDGLIDFMLYRATASPAVTKEWKWHLGSDVPASASPHNLPSVPAHLTEVPDELMCPISHGVMEDAVTAADSHTYSRSAIKQWFEVGRKSSPMHGLELANTHLTDNDTVSNKVSAWIHGRDIIRPTSSRLQLTFVSRVGKFERVVHRDMSVSDLYKLAFRGHKAHFEHLQLARSNERALAPALTTIEAAGIRSGDEITVRLADEADMGVSSTGNSTARASTEKCLIKVYDVYDRFTFAYWTRKGTTCTLESVLAKYWRHEFSANAATTIQQRQVWSDLVSSGDDLLAGQPRDATEKLASLLTGEHCLGRLDEEPVYSEPRAVLDRFSSTGQPLVLKLKISHLRRSQGERCKFTRLDVLKQMFEALINRIIAYNFNTHVGLISFGETATVAQPISHVIENFRRAVSQLHAHGNTALWEALQLAHDQIQQYAASYPNAKKRVITISDGANTKASAVQAHDIAFTMMNDNIVVDSITLGDEDFSELRAVSHNLGGYKFHPASLENALQICELEPFLSFSERPPIVLHPSIPRNRMAYMANFFTAQMTARTTTVNSDVFPPRKGHPNINDPFVELSQAHARRPVGASQGGTRSTLRTSRIMNEINRVVATSADRAYDVYVSESDMSFFKVVMRGPTGSPYTDGVFLLYLHMGDSFPTFAPEARFVTKIRHPNVNAHGRICHALLSRDWTSDVSLTTVLDAIYGLLLQAETSDPVNTAATLGYHHDQVEYNEEVREFTERHASKTAEQWRQELLGEVEPEGEEDEDMD